MSGHELIVCTHTGQSYTTMRFQASAESMLRVVVRCLGLVTGERHAIATNVPRYHRFPSLHEVTSVLLNYRADSIRICPRMDLCYGSPLPSLPLHIATTSIDTSSFILLSFIFLIEQNGFSSSIEPTKTIPSLYKIPIDTHIGLLTRGDRLYIRLPATSETLLPLLLTYSYSLTTRLLSRYTYISSRRAHLTPDDKSKHEVRFRHSLHRWCHLHQRYRRCRSRSCSQAWFLRCPRYRLRP